MLTTIAIMIGFSLGLIDITVLDDEGGGGPTPPPYTPSLDFSDARNSQYALMGLVW